MKKILLLAAFFIMAFSSVAMCSPVVPADAINPVVQVVLACVIAGGIMLKMFSHYKGNKSNVITNRGAVITNGSGLDSLLAELEEDFDKMNLNGKDGRQIASKITQLKQQRVSMVGEISSNATITGLIAESVGDLNITITRNTANIAEPLPYVLFGLNAFNSSYASIIKAFLSSGTAFSMATDADGNVVMSYTKGGVTDTVTISFSGLTNYSDFLHSQNQNYFKTKYILYSIDDVANKAQFRQLLNFGLSSALGAKNANQLNLNSRIMTWDFKDDRVNLVMPEQKVGADFSFVQNILAVAGHTISMDVYMSEKQNLNKAL